MSNSSLHSEHMPFSWTAVLALPSSALVCLLPLSPDSSRALASSILPWRALALRSARLAF